MDNNLDRIVITMLALDVAHDKQTT